jgi:hypothetical protein
MQPLAVAAPRRISARAVLVPGIVALSGTASAQIQFSVDWKSHSLARPDALQGRPITEADVLVVGTGGPPQIGITTPPGIVALGSQLSLNQYQSCVGHPAGTPCGIEVDALSSGEDDPFLPNALTLGAGTPPPRRIWFSVDRFAVGLAPAPVLTHPQVASEGPPPVFEACADLFVDVGLPSGPLPPGAVVPNNAGAIDGNGAISASGFVYPGLGLSEPFAPPPAPPGDDLDALELGEALAVTGSTIFFSLDSGFGDPLTGAANSGTAAANGFVGGDVLSTIFPGGAVALYAPANALGLDLVPGAGADSDDLDALAVFENGVAGFQPSAVPYDWVGGATDMVIFSVRRGSAVVNRPDSIFGIPIQPGDLLTTPKPAALGGLSPFPGIFIAAENIGLFTARGSAVEQGDDLDALDISKKPVFDCNENGVEDAVDIATGASADNNKNGIPDECEDGIVEFCWCPLSLAPCGNDDPAAGCENSDGLGALSLTSGTRKLSQDDLVITTSQVPANVNAIMFMGPTSKPPGPFYDGLRCIATPVYRWAMQNAGPAGTLVYGPGLGAESVARFPPAGWIDVGDTWYFQTWYRDASGPCNHHANISNAVKVTFEY